MTCVGKKHLRFPELSSLLGAVVVWKLHEDDHLAFPAQNGECAFAVVQPQASGFDCLMDRKLGRKGSWINLPLRT
ncbi:uncharacterized protein RSE6_03837 [Rhynchosporium secalis]|uniref:Uncharacterized protein n=1 Tax=Rhynchosporium secalis TaxID=38038 RepID=A0A1E1M3T4_RHYSE|nr:uncharacterized protein RSE6_03837 [Rhynchosporium secalis]